MLSVDVWFCDHSEWWGVWLCGFTLGGGFGVVGGSNEHIHICVCMPDLSGRDYVVAPPTVRSLEQVAVANFF
jgi:hypothetical protein